MQIGLILQYISPIVVPAWILFDSKKRLGRYSWAIALLVALALAGLVRQTLFELEKEFMSEPFFSDMIIWGKAIAAYLIPVVVYRTILRRPNDPAGRKDDESKEP